MPLPSQPLTRSFQWDLARQVERLDWLIAQLPRYADWGYDEVHLHLEDAVEYPSLPGVARRDAYTYKQFARLVDAATRAKINVVPIVNLLGHTQYLVKVPELRDLNELRADDGSPLPHGQICPLHPRTLEVADRLLRDMAPFCTAGKVHVGLDESFHLGKHPLSRKEIADVGLAAHFANYVNRLNELTRSRQLAMGMWADMLYFIPDAIQLLPPNITTYEWYYHAFRRHPRVELFNFAEVDLTNSLRQRKIARYGCPMNGAFRFEPLPHFGDRMNNIVAWWQHATRTDAAGFLVSSWEPYRLAIELTTAIDAAAATLWLEPEISDPAKMLARGFQRAFGKAGRHAAKVALACDRYPFSGYPRWEINQSWATISPREPHSSYAAEARHFSRLYSKAAGERLPIALKASVGFRAYLAERDVHVRRLAKLSSASDRSTATAKAAKALEAKLRNATASGLTNARLMWRRSRDPNLASPNEQIVKADRQRLDAWRRGEPVFGGTWQLCYSVWNFAPAAQLVGVEQLGEDGEWQILQSCHTIEFQSAAARPRSEFIREHAAPVEWDGDRKRPPRVRVFVRGVGEVKIGDIELRGGGLSLSPKRSKPDRWRRVGIPATRSGWPTIFTKADGAVIEIIF